MSSSVPLSLGGKLIGGCYLLREKIGSGSYGDVFVGTHCRSGIEVAVKIEGQHPTTNYLLHESQMYKTLEGAVGIPKFISFCKEGPYNALVLEKVGPNLHQLFRNCTNIFSLKTVLMLAEQILTCIQVTHEKGIIHCDISPKNICIGSGGNEDKVYLIDFGLSKIYRDPTTGAHIPSGAGHGIIMPTLFGSKNKDTGFQQSRLDDLESIGYILVYFIREHLPWDYVRGKKKEIPYRKKIDVKTSASAAEVCENCPSEFVDYMTYCHELRFDETPDYEYLRMLFRNLFKSKKYTQDSRFDWDSVTTQSTSAVDDAVKRLQPTKDEWRRRKPNNMPAVSLHSPVQEMDESWLAEVDLVTSEAPCLTKPGDIKVASPPRHAKSSMKSATARSRPVKTVAKTAAASRLSALAGVRKTGASRLPMKSNDITATKPGRLAKAGMKTAAAQRQSLEIADPVAAPASDG